ncbi:hypothetical protein XTGART2_2979 [Xanthomonas translucens pv. graminis]|nr:hypothetical protein XTGART2_2979 [Xanthomonas translucens pv. graminis]
MLGSRDGADRSAAAPMARAVPGGGGRRSGPGRARSRGRTPRAAPRAGPQRSPPPRRPPLPSLRFCLLSAAFNSASVGFGRLRRGFARLQRGDLAARLEPELAFGDHPFAGLQALLQLHLTVAHFHALPDRLHLDRVVALHHVHVVAIGAALHRLGRHHHAAGQGAQGQPHVDELARPQRVAGVGELGADLEGAGVAADLIVDHVDLAVAGDHVRVGAVQRRHRQRSGRQRLAQALQLALGQVEDHVDRMDLGDGDDVAAGADDVAHVHAADAGDAVDRGEDAGVLQLHLRRAHRCVVGGDRRLVLRHLVALRVQVGLGHVLAVGRRIGALEGGAGGGQQRLVLALARRRLVVAGLQRARVDLRQHLALLHFLAFAEVQAHQLAAHLRVDRDRGQRGHRAVGGGVDRYRLAAGGDHRHRDRRAVVAIAARPRAAAAMSAAQDVRAHQHHGHRCDD